MLDINGYEGDLRFDNETKELMLDVQKQNSAESQTNDVKALRYATFFGLPIELCDHV